MLNLHRLEVLHAVATHGSVTAAAEALHVTTSAISQQMARLERETRQRLVQRRGRGIVLTDAGVLLAGHADSMLTLVRRAEADLEAHDGTVAGHLGLGAFATAIRGLVVPALTTLRAEYPDLRVTVDEREPHESLPLVSRGDLDVAIVQDWPDAPLAIAPDLEETTLTTDVFDVALPAAHPLARAAHLRIDELRDELWITWKTGWICNEWVTRTLNGPEVVAHTAGEHHTQLSLVAAGHGIALIPRMGRDPVPEGVRFAEVRPALARRVFAVRRSDASRRPAVRAVVDALRAGVTPPG